MFSTGLDRYATGSWLSHIRVRLNNHEGYPVIQILWTVLMLLIGGFLGASLGSRHRPVVPMEMTAPVIGKITDLAELVVLRVPVSKVHVSTLSGYVGSVSCVILVQGELELGTDLNLARFEQVDTDAHTATLLLAEPKVRRARLNHEQTSVYRIDLKGLWKGLPSAEPSRKVVNQAMTEAQGCVESSGDDPQFVDRARRHTEQVLRQFLGAMGWEVKLVWSGDQPAQHPG